MNTRKFSFLTTLITSVFLFFSGLLMLNYINTSSEAYALPTNGGVLDEIIKDYKNTNKPFNVLVLGGDRVAKNTDTMMLVNYDPSTAKISILSIPRDTKVKINGTNRKINYAFPYGGPELAVQTVSKLLDVNIKYYVYLDTKAFREIIDLLGGVDYYVPVDMDYDDPLQNLHIHLKKGQQPMDGKAAEAYMRFRQPNYYTKEIKKYYDGSDLKRIDAQQNFIKELINQKMKLYNVTKLKDIIYTIFDNLETNFDLNNVVKLSTGITKINPDEINMLKLPGTTYNASPWYYLCDNEAARELTREYFIAKESFVSIPDSSKIDIADNNDSSKNTGKNTVNTSLKTPEKSFTESNPSNNGTSVKPSDGPMP